MPTYEYRCRDCGHSFDIVQKMSDEALTHCPECGGELRKVFAPPAISFKGSGFYATDHGKKSKPSGGEKKKDGDKGSSETGGSEAGGSREGGGSRESSKDTGSAKKETSSEGSSSSTTTKKEGSS
jgi:putative FmdB family regulatory protein